MESSENNNSRAWLKVAELSAGMQIAVPKAGCFAAHGNVLADDSILEDGGGDVMWDEIAEIRECAEERVYDIEVEGTHNFVAGHLIDRSAAEVAAGFACPSLSALSPVPVPAAEVAHDIEERYKKSGIDAGTLSKLGKDVFFGGIFAHNTYISGNTGLGTSTPWRTLGVTGTVGFSSSLTTGTGQALNIDSTTFEVIRNTSSERYKNTITDLELDSAQIYQLAPRSFTWNAGTANPGQRDFGLIAEEVAPIFPKLVWNNGSGTPEAVRYDMLSVLLLNEMQRRNQIVNLTGAPTSTPSLVIGASGNVGVGSTTPAYKLSVEGEVAAQAFVNISTASEKRDIEYLGDDDNLTILEKIRNTNVATYQYKNDRAISSVIPAKSLPSTRSGAGIQFSRNGLDSGSEAGMTNVDDLTGGKRLGLIAENAPSEVLAAGGKGVDLYKLGTFVLAGLKAESKEREAGALALDTRIAEEMAALREKTATKQLTVEGAGNGDLLSVIASPEGAKQSRNQDAGIASSSLPLAPLGVATPRNDISEPIFRITASGEVQVRDDIVFGAKRSVIALNEPKWVVALSADEAEAGLRPAYKGAVIVVGAADGTHVFNAKTHKEMSGYAVIASPADLGGAKQSYKRDEGGLSDVRLQGIDKIASSSRYAGLLAMTLRRIAADYFTQPFGDNTLAQWPFKTLADATGRGNDLNMSGSVSLTADGVRGTAAAFDGSGYLSAPAVSLSFPRKRESSSDARGLDSGSPPLAEAGMTVGAWVKFNSLSSGQKIISQDGVFSLSLGEGGYMEATVQGASKVATRKSLAALDNDWHYVVASYSALKARLDIYADGNLSNGDLIGEIPLTGLGLSSEPVKLGVGFYGAMDDAFIAAADVDVSSSAALASSSVIPAKSLPSTRSGAGIQTPDTIRTNYLVGRKALNYGLAATSGLQAQPTSAAVDDINNMLYVGTADGQIITVDLGADAVVGRQTPVIASPADLGGAKQSYKRDEAGLSDVRLQGIDKIASSSLPLAPLGVATSRNDTGITALAVSSGAGRTLAAIVGNQLWLDSETVSVRDSLSFLRKQESSSGASGLDSRSGSGMTEGGRRALTVFSDLLITGGKILPEASSGLPLFAITADGVVQGLAFRDVSFANELVNGSFEYWDGEGKPLNWSSVIPAAFSPRESGEGIQFSRNGLDSGSKAGMTKDAKFGLSSIQITDGILSTTLSNASDFASSTVTLSAWVKTSVANDTNLSVVVPAAFSPRESGEGIQSIDNGLDSGSGAGMTEGVVASSAYHSGSGQWERLIVSAVIPASSVIPAKAGIQIQIQSASKTALADGVMLQRGGLPTAFVPSIADTLLANPQYLNFTTAIAVSASSTPSEQIIAKLPAGTFKNSIRIDQLSVGFSSVIPAEAGIQIVATNGIDTIVCAAAGSSCRQSGSLIINPNQELLIKYSVQAGADAKATINLRYYPIP